MLINAQPADLDSHQPETRFNIGQNGMTLGSST
jgi:hypothetical protein